MYGRNFVRFRFILMRNCIYFDSVVTFTRRARDGRVREPYNACYDCKIPSVAGTRSVNNRDTIATQGVLLIRSRFVNRLYYLCTTPDRTVYEYTSIFYRFAVF